MTRASSDPQDIGLGGRIIAAEALAGVAAYDWGELDEPQGRPLRTLTSRDLSNDTARAAFELGRKRGFEQGRRDGLAEGARVRVTEEARLAEEVARRVQPLADEFRAGLAVLESDLAADLVSLAVDIARQVLRRELELDPAALVPAAREALNGLAEGAAHVQLHVHPEDAVMLEEHLEAVHLGRCRLKPDPMLPRGSCRVEGDSGIAEAGFAQRWQAVMATLGREWEEAP